MGVKEGSFIWLTPFEFWLNPPRATKIRNHCGISEPWRKHCEQGTISILGTIQIFRRRYEVRNFFYEWRAIDFGLVIAFRHLSTGNDGEKCRPPDYTVFLQGTLTPLRSRNHVCHWVESPKLSNRRFEFAQLTWVMRQTLRDCWGLITMTRLQITRSICCERCAKRFLFLTTPKEREKPTKVTQQ